MSITARPYAGAADLDRMASLVYAHPAHAFHVTDLPYRLSSPALETEANGQLWEAADGTLRGWAVYQPPWGTLDYAIHPAAEPDVERAILAWGLARFQQLAQEYGRTLDYYVDAHEADAVVEELTLFPRNVEAGQGTFLPGHEWLIEFSRQPKDADLFLGALDAELCRLNPLYRVRRGSSFGETPLLAAPAVCALKRGTYQSWQTRSGRQGGHFKVPRISSSESFKLELLRESQCTPGSEPNLRSKRPVGPEKIL